MYTDSEGRAEEVEKKKKEHLQAQKEGKNKWEEQLASDSESAVCTPSHDLSLLKSGVFITS